MAIGNAVVFNGDESIYRIVPSTGCVAGNIYFIDGIGYVARETASSGATASFIFGGPVLVNKTAGQSFADGDPVYWNGSTFVATSTGGANVLIGAAIAASAGGDSTVRIFFGITGVSSPSQTIVIPGQDGADGADAPIIPGPPGADGAAGAAGATGPAGIGIPGQDGEDGADAPIISGPAGATGATGSTGATGGTGIQGPPGRDGEDGEPGPMGPPGIPAATATGGNLVDADTFIVGNVDPTKRLTTQVDNQAAGTTLTLDTGTQTADRTLTVPPLNSADNIVTTETNQDINGIKTFQGGLVIQTADAGIYNVNVALGTGAGTKWGIGGAGEKQAWWGATPIVQPSGNVLTALSNLGLVASPTLQASDITGLSGPPGFDGNDGEDAPIIPGPAGSAGATGATGATGAAGTGSPGMDGADGADANYGQMNSGSFAIAEFWAKIASSPTHAITGAATAQKNRVNYVTGTSANYDITMPTAVAGDVCGFIVGEYAVSNKVYRLDAGAAVIIAGRTRYLSLVHTNVVLLYYDGTKWHPLVLNLETLWIEMGDITITAQTTNPTKGNGGNPTTDYHQWRRIGDTMHVRYHYYQSTAGAAGSGTYKIGIPLSAVVNETIAGNAPDADSFDIRDAKGGLGWGKVTSVSAGGYHGVPFMRTTGSGGLAFSLLNFTGASAGLWGSTVLPFSTTQVAWYMEAFLPITDW